MSSLSEIQARRLLRFLRAQGKALSPLLIMTHDVPDPDAIGSAYALQYLARSMFGIRSRIVYGGMVGRMENRLMIRALALPLHRLRKIDLARHRHVALVDTQPAFRNNSFPADRRASIVIDQHEDGGAADADWFIDDPGCGATCVILARALLLAGAQLTSRVATALAYGIVTDTLNFFRARRSDIIQTYLAILPHCDMGALAHIQNPQLGNEYFVLMARGIERARVRRRLIVAHLGQVEDPDAVSQIADMLLTYNGMRYALCTGRYRGSLRVSLRMAQRGSSASDLLQDAVDGVGQAGGHDTIAGGAVSMGRSASKRAWRIQEQAIEQRLCRKLKIPRKRTAVRPFV